MRLKTFSVDPLQVNCYIVIDENSKECIAIDIGGNPLKIIDFIKSENLDLKAIVLTHGHYDHIGGCLEVRDKFKVPIICGDGEEVLLTNPNLNLATMFNDDLCFSPDKKLKDNDTFEFGSLCFNVIETPGHTPGGICLYFEREGVLFSGDTLFYLSVGRTDFPLGNTNSLLNSLEKLKKLPDDTIVYSGHGMKTSIGFEKQHNPYMS